jgi:amino acid adenylation domain-containing protein
MRPHLLHQAFEPWFGSEAAAVGGAEGQPRWSYRQLERASRKAALRLLASGLAPGARVGVWMRKSPPAVGAMLGALRAGLVAVPFDAAAPEARIAALARDCQLGGLIADSDLLPAARDWPLACRVERDELDGPGGSGELPPAARTAGDAAYILYTSGSTGVPKGVMLSHAHALAFIDWAASEVALGPGDRVASHAPFHFDLSVFDLWATLSRGATVELMDAATVRLARAASEFIVERGINVWYSVPSALVRMLPHAERVADGAGLRSIVFAGEVFPPPALNRWRRALPLARFHNWYGPTETNVCTAYTLPPFAQAAAEVTRPLPLGESCCGFELRLADEQCRPIAPGGAGLLWVRGPGVMLGYWGDHERTAQVMQTVPSPAGGLEETWYNTGDWVERTSAGELHYLGRRDGLIKLRGFRVSLLEIERTLEASGLVAQAAVVVAGALTREDSEGRLVAFVQLAPEAWPGGEAAEVELRRFVGERLPSYMVPEHIEVGVQWLLTSTGKIDRRALAAAWPRPARAEAA